MSQMRLWIELGLVNSDPGWSFILLAGVDGADGASSEVFLRIRVKPFQTSDISALPWLIQQRYIIG